MNNFDEIWNYALPYLKKGIRKDFVLHTKGVVYAMELLLKKEKGDPSILIPAAILHDTGWSNVPLDLQRSDKEEEKNKALKLHLKYAEPIIWEILKKVNFSEEKIQKIVDLVLAHKFCKPKEFEKQLLIDADTLADTFKEQFNSNYKYYNVTPEDHYNFRKKNDKYYSKTAIEISSIELKKRKEEFGF